MKKMKRIPIEEIRDRMLIRIYRKHCTETHQMLLDALKNQTLEYSEFRDAMDCGSTKILDQSMMLSKPLHLWRCRNERASRLS